MERRDPTAPEADVAEQATDWTEAEEPEETTPRIDIDVPEADALEQSRPGLDEDDDEVR